MGDVIVLIILAVIIGLVIRSLVKNHKDGGHCSGCSRDCSGCSSGCCKEDKSSFDK